MKKTPRGTKGSRPVRFAPGVIGTGDRRAMVGLRRTQKEILLLTSLSSMAAKFRGVRTMGFEGQGPVFQMVRVIFVFWNKELQPAAMVERNLNKTQDHSTDGSLGNRSIWHRRKKRKAR